MTILWVRLSWDWTTNMPVEITGFARALVRCLDFESVDPGELESVLADANAPLTLSVVEPLAEPPLIRSGTPFEHFTFVQDGVVVPWQYPYSELKAPFLIGEHEFLMGAERWVASYSAVTETIVVDIPVETMRSVVEAIPRVRERMRQLVMRRLARFYWTSLATTGSPSSRVAAALVSRLALDGADHDQGRTISIRQKDLARLTTMSRSAVADGLAELARLKAIRLDDANRTRYAGIVLVPEVDHLKRAAFSEVLGRTILGMVDHVGEN